MTGARKNLCESNREKRGEEKEDRNKNRGGRADVSAHRQYDAKDVENSERHSPLLLLCSCSCAMLKIRLSIPSPTDPILLNMKGTRARNRIPAVALSPDHSGIYRIFPSFFPLFFFVPLSCTPHTSVLRIHSRREFYPAEGTDEAQIIQNSQAVMMIMMRCNKNKKRTCDQMSRGDGAKWAMGLYLKRNKRMTSGKENLILLLFVSQGVPSGEEEELKIGYDDPFVSLVRQNALLSLSLSLSLYQVHTSFEQIDITAC